MSSFQRLVAIDLRELSEAEMRALRQEAISLGMPIEEYLGKVTEEASARLVKRNQELMEERSKDSPKRPEEEPGK